MTDEIAVHETLVEILKGQLGRSPKPNDSLTELDSIDLMELSMAIELHFGIEITGAEISELGTVLALSRVVGSPS